MYTLQEKKNPIITSSAVFLLLRYHSSAMKYSVPCLQCPTTAMSLYCLLVKLITSTFRREKKVQSLEMMAYMDTNCLLNGDDRHAGYCGVCLIR